MTRRQQPTLRSWGRRIVMLLVPLPGLALVAAAIGDQIHVHLLRAGVQNPDAAIRSEALRQVAHQRERRAVAPRGPGSNE